jgi:argininosuccinate lyase
MSQAKQTLDQKQLWASRFKKATDPRAKQYSESITVDRPMFNENIWGNEAHTIMLAYCDIITDDQCRNILKALQEIKVDFKEKKWDLQLQEEDLQMNVERYVIDASGIENGGRMHTTRSRNDQVPTDTKLFAREQLIRVIDILLTFINQLLTQAEEHTETIMPGYTHTQHAQPITYAYWLSHYAVMFHRDVQRLMSSLSTLDQNPLGAGALTGTSFPIDRKLTTRLLGFEGIQVHALDAVGAKDTTLELLADFAILFSSMSRLADEIIYGITYEFNTMVLDDGFSMGSSMMPQKKNPGVLELVRGRTGKMYGILMHLLTTIKGLPSGYNRDYHEDKTTVVDALTLSYDTINLMEGVMETLTIKPERMKYLVQQNFATATELANYLVRNHDIPFRLCHRIVGFVVGQLVEEGKNFTDKERTKELLAEKEINISDEDYEAVLNPECVIRNYTSLGGVAPKEVTRMIVEIKEQCNNSKKALSLVVSRIDHAKSETRQLVTAILKGNTVKESVENLK